MIKQFASIALLSATILSLNACNKAGGFKKTATGLEYNIIKDVKGDTLALGDVVTLQMVIRYKDDKMDTIVFDSYKMNNNKPIEFPLPAPTFKGDISEGFSLLTAGDSAIFRISVDSLKKAGAQMPEWMKSGNKIEYAVKMISVKKKVDIEKEKEEHAAGQTQKDESMLQDYFVKNNIKPAKTPVGVYYTIEKEGSGATAQPGQSITVNYTGRTLDGTPFDSNVDPKFGHTEPFTLELGRGNVIRGWDEGLLFFKKGTKGKLFIPSALAYGENSPSPQIPADAILIFDITVTDISAAPAQKNPIQ